MQEPSTQAEGPPSRAPPLHAAPVSQQARPDVPQHRPSPWQRPLAQRMAAVPVLHFGTHAVAPASTTSQTVSGFAHGVPGAAHSRRQTSRDGQRWQTPWLQVPASHSSEQ